MLIHIESFLFNSLVATQTDSFLQSVEDDKTHAECPCADSQSTNGLCQHVCLCAVQFRVYENTCEDRSKNTANAMHADSTNRVVDVE